jgi:hypothetical protein
MADVDVGHYRQVVPIRCRGVIHFYSALDPDSDRLRVLVMAPRVAAAEGRARLAGFARVHRLVAGGAIPAVVDENLDGPTPWIALDCNAVADLEHLIDHVRQGGAKPDYERAAAVGKTLMETLARCHRVKDPETGRPVCMGSIAAGNLLFGADGKMWIVGFGGGSLSGACIAPEVASGGPPTPSGDVFALVLFVRGQIEFVQLPSLMRRVISGKTIAKDAKMLLLYAWSNMRILGAPASARPNMDVTLDKARSLWRTLRFEPDIATFGAWASGVIAAPPERLADAPPREGEPGIRLGRNGEWLETPNGMRHALGARRPLRRLLLALAEAHRDRAGASLSVAELLQVGWPGEDPLPEAGNNRVYVAISTLRKLGLGDLLQRWDGGYRLDPGVRCQI